ncbi:MAG: sporulation protein YunB [Clostridiales bacterium]|nr:sporulation protein YunB [Clostridiales bacterium]MCF8023106.1 sporulation protein YunB [Clostridiales bacterium]
MFKQRKSFKKYFVLTLIACVLAGMFLFLDYHVRPTIYSISEVKVTQMAIDCINETVRNEMTKKNIDYQDFITWHKDNQGRVAVMQANTIKVNQLQSEMALNVQKRLKELEDKVLHVPLGQITGSYIFAHYGPDINVKIRSMGTVDVQVDDKFQHAGINQTRHKIYFNFDTMVKIVIPLGASKVNIATQVPIAESIIVGEVPEVVADFSGGIFGKSSILSE